MRTRVVVSPVESAAFASITSLGGTLIPLSTHPMFDSTHTLGEVSPIDEFIENSNSLNLIYVRGLEISRELGVVVLLGYMSAVESYFRAMVSGLINIDECTRRRV